MNKILNTLCIVALVLAAAVLSAGCRMERDADDTDDTNAAMTPNATGTAPESGFPGSAADSTTTTPTTSDAASPGAAPGPSGSSTDRASGGSTVPPDDGSGSGL